MTNYQFLKYSLFWFFLRWLQYIALLVDGILGGITLGFYDSRISLKVMGWFLNFSCDHPEVCTRKSENEI